MQKLEELRIDIMILLNDREAEPTDDLIAVAEMLCIVFKDGHINEWDLKEWIYCERCSSYQEGQCVCYSR